MTVHLSTPADPDPWNKWTWQEVVVLGVFVVLAIVFIVALGGAPRPTP